MKVKYHSEDVNQLIAKVKPATVKNITRQFKFATIGCPSQLVVSRWGSRLNAAFFYAKNLPEVKAIVEVLKGLLLWCLKENLTCKQLVLLLISQNQ